MKNIYVIIIVLVLALVGFLIFSGKDDQVSQSLNSETQSSTNTTTETTNTTNEVKEFNISGSNFSFTPNSLTVKKGDAVRINFKNIDGFHDFKIDEFNVGTKVIKSGETESIEFIADKIGSFQYYCSVGAHRANGMWGVLKVVE